MGSCVSTHQKPSAMKVQMLYDSNDIKPPIINGDLPAKPRDFGSKEEVFFDSQAWLDSDCDDDFMSVNGEFTPSRGNTPVHHNFSAGNNRPPISPSPNEPEKKMRLSDLFQDSLRDSYDSEFEQNGPKSKAESPLVHGSKTKRERFGRSVQNCFPSLISSRSSSTNSRKMMSPGMGPSPTLNTVVG